MYEIPNLVYADESGNIFDHPELHMAVAGEQFTFVPYELELMPLPDGARLVYLPGAKPVAHDRETAGMTTMNDGTAVAAILPKGYIRLFLPAIEKTGAEAAKKIPESAYAPVGWMNDTFVVPAIQVDDPRRIIGPERAKDKAVIDQISRVKKDLPDNRIIDHIASCAVDAACPTALAVFLGGNEASIPTTPTKKDACPDCLAGTTGTCPLGDRRMDVTPKAAEIVEVAKLYADKRPDGIISFGTECEGDPLDSADVIVKALPKIREAAPEATITVNTTGTDTLAAKKLFDAGIDAIRISLNSVVDSTYNAYYREARMNLDNALKTIELAGKYGIHISVNLMIMPGMNDRVSETGALIDFCKAYGIHHLQLTDIPVEPEKLFSKFSFKKEDILGIKNMLRLIKKKYSTIQFGAFNRSRKDFTRDSGLPNLKRRGS